MIYFLQAASGAIKIGFTNSWPQRLESLRQGTHEHLEPLLVIDGAKAEEQALLVCFSADRLRGEWFKPSLALTTYIESRRPDALTFAPKEDGRRMRERSSESAEEQADLARLVERRCAKAIGLLRAAFDRGGVQDVATMLGASRLHVQYLYNAFITGRDGFPPRPPREMTASTLDRIMRMLGGERLRRPKVTAGVRARVERLESVDLITLVRLRNPQNIRHHEAA